MNRAYKFRIYPTRKQEILIHKTFGCCRFVYNHMLADKKQAYEETKKTIKITSAAYKKEYPWLKEVDSLALANEQLHLERAYRKFFEESKIGFPKFKSKHGSRKSYTTNVVNGNIRISEGKLRLPKTGTVKIRLHREIPAGWTLKSVTVSMDPSGKYYASLLFAFESCENQAGTVREEKVLVLIMQCMGWQSFLQERSVRIRDIIVRHRKGWPGNKEGCRTAGKAAGTIRSRSGRWQDIMKRSEINGRITITSSASDWQRNTMLWQWRIWI